MEAIPIRLGKPEDFGAVRNFLVDAGYNERTVCERLGLRGMHEYLGSKCASAAAAPLERGEAFDLLLGLFLTGSFADRDLVHSVLPAGVLRPLEALGLVLSGDTAPGLYYSPVALYPIRGLYMVSDRWSNPDSSPFQVLEDSVFPALHGLTHGFLEILPQDPCERLLDLGCGTGIAALLAATAYARQSWAVDITARSAAFAEFNCRLNGITNTVVKQGDLYEPVCDLVFDRIVAHPPYIPVLRPVSIYCDGGEDGEQVLRGLIKGLPRSLKANGRFYSLTMGIERDGEPFEQRVRSWLGESQSSFDVLFVAEWTQGPSQFAFRQAKKTPEGWEEMDRWKAHLKALKVRNFVFGLLMIQRRESAAPSFTLRRQRGTRLGPAEVEWLRGWETASAGEASLPLLLQTRPLVSSRCELRVTHTIRDGKLTPSKFILTANYPFATESEWDPWVASLLARCDGKSTVAEHFAGGKREGWLSGDMSIEPFAGRLAALISEGILEIESFRPPRQTSQPR